jgi:hypothetical protein
VLSAIGNRVLVILMPMILTFSIVLPKIVLPFLSKVELLHFLDLSFEKPPIDRSEYFPPMD